MDVKTGVAGENLFEVEVCHPKVVDDEKEEFAVRRVVGALMEGREKRGGGKKIISYDYHQQPESRGVTTPGNVYQSPPDITTTTLRLPVPSSRRRQWRWDYTPRALCNHHVAKE